MPGLHAKVLILDDSVVIGSANLSTNSKSLREAAVVLTDSGVRSDIGIWINELKRSGTGVNKEFVRRIREIKVVRAGGGRGGPTKLSLLQGFEANDAHLKDIIFRVWSEPTVNTTQQVEAAAKASGRFPVLPEHWTFFEDPSSRAHKQNLLGLQQRFLISFQGFGPEPSGLERIESLDPDNLSYLGFVTIKGWVVSIFDTQKPGPFHLGGPDAKRLRDRINKGIKARPELLKRINGSAGWLFSASTLRELLRAGTTTK